jgi:hypothetical protein
MVPGFFYGENRRDDQHAAKLYPRFDPSLATPAAMTSAWWDFAADRTAIPMVYAHQAGQACAVAALPHYESRGDCTSDDPEPQVGVGFGHNGRSGHIRFTVPACEEPFTYTNSPLNAPTVRRLTLAPGAEISGTFLVYRAAGDRHAYQPFIEHYVKTVAPDHPRPPVPDLVPLVEDASHGIIAGHYVAKENYFLYSRPYDPVTEQIANGRGITMEWHQMMSGFVGGLPVCRGLLNAAALIGNAEARRTAMRVADRFCTEGLSPSGLFWADYVPRTVRTPNGEFANPVFTPGRNEWGSGWLSGTTRVHSRTVSDACDNLAGMLLDERARGRPLRKTWLRALGTNLRAALDLQLPDGRYGQYYDAGARRVVKADGCGGLLWIPAMIKACDLGLGGKGMTARMRDSVLRAAAAYAPYVEAENIWGAPEDNDSPTSEDGQNAVMAYCDLYAATGDDRWLRLGQLAAEWMLTFRKAVNVRLPPQSIMGRYGLRSRGGDFASASNNHLHVFEVLCTRHLCSLSRWTGNSYFRDRALDHWAFACQYLSRCDGMYNGFRGAMAEQFYWTNWGSWGGRYLTPAYHRQKGNMAPFTALWCISVLLQAAPDVAREF